MPSRHAMANRARSTAPNAQSAPREIDSHLRKLTRRGVMKATMKLQALGQSLWLDNITRDLLGDGTLARYRDEYNVTGLTSNPSIYLKAIRDTSAYDIDIAKAADPPLTDEALFFSLAIKDLRQAAELFLPVHQRTQGVDGWVSLEVSPWLTEDAVGTLAAAKSLHASARCPNLFIKIPGTATGVMAIEEAIFAGVPVNVTLLFSREQYIEAANAYWRGLARRRDAGLDLRVASVASLFVSRWDTAVTGEVPFGLRNRLGVAIAKQTYGAYRDRMSHPMWRELADAGASPQTSVVGQYRREEPGNLAGLLRRSACRTRHHQHHAGGDVAGFCHGRRVDQCHARGRR